MSRNEKSVAWMMLSALPLLLGARPLKDGGMDLQAESRLWVGGTSSVRGWECKTTTFSATVESTPNAAATVLAGEKAVGAVNLTVPVDKMECGNGQMNGHMRKALKIGRASCREKRDVAGVGGARRQTRERQIMR